MSIGASVPISTRFWLSFSDCCDSASDSCCAFEVVSIAEQIPVRVPDARDVWIDDRIELDVRRDRGDFLLLATCFPDLIDRIDCGAAAA
jgi:hypothetical protein